MSKYSIDNKLVIFCTFNVKQTITLGYGMLRWIKKEKWPPCDNYGDEEPLNLLTFGDDNSNECECDCCSNNKELKHNNCDENMIVIVYPKSNSRIGYNKYMLLEWIEKEIKSNNKPSDPISRINFNDENIINIKNGKHYTEIYLSS